MVNSKKEKKYYLVTTALRDSWPEDTIIKFLGKWCLRPSHESYTKSLDFEIEPYHWDDREKLFEDYLFLKQVYERYLISISEELNRVHNTRFSLRYWRILVGPWLSQFIAIIFDRWSMINQAVEMHPNLETTLINFPQEQMIPKDLAAFKENFFWRDDWNHFIYGEILQYTGFQNVNTANYLSGETDKSIKSDADRINFKAKIKVILKYTVQKFLSYFNNSNQFFFYLSGLHPFQQWKLELALGNFPSISDVSHYIRMNKSNEMDISIQVDLDLRSQLNINSHKESQFESFLSKIIPIQIPLSYLEGFENLLDRKKAVSWPKAPTTIITSSAFNFDDYFNAWTAEKLEEGAKLIITQHGGHYGTGLWSGMEDHELKISDKYFSWGWIKDPHQNIVPLPSAKLLSKSRKMKCSSSGDLLLIGQTYPRYSYHMFSSHVSSQYKIYEQDQFAFINSMSREVKNKLRIRFKQDAYGWDQKTAYCQHLDNPVFDSLKTTLSDSLKKARLAVVNANFTSHLETFAANVPTVIFWDPTYNELRPEAEPFFDKLVDAGILFYDPVAAAKQVNSIWSDVPGWWNQDTVQDAKDAFAYNFARVSDDWLQDWKKALE